MVVGDGAKGREGYIQSMFIGHLGLALAAKTAAPRTSLGTLGAAAQWVDLVWPVLLLAGIERVRIDPGNTAFTPLDFEHYPWTHSLVMAAVWALAFALAYRARTGYARGAAVVGALVASHWLLDVGTHRPDLPLAPWLETRLGLGLWNSVAATVVVEGAIFAAGVAAYVRGTRPRDRTGTWSLVALVAFLLAAWVANMAGPPPPSARAIGFVGLSMWLLVAWMAWADRHREPR
jgi:membrane-bound metal-dependent hydrolase YbcI (DUF457 family)